MANLEHDFNAAMHDLYLRAKSEVNYNASMFLRMITDSGGLAAAKTLINASKPSDGYTAFWEIGRLDLTVEAVVVENKRWHELFTSDELARARKRLTDYGYRPTESPPSSN